jgi:hypothetical protein
MFNVNHQHTPLQTFSKNATTNMSTYETKLAIKTKYNTATTTIIFLYTVLPNGSALVFGIRF